MKFRITKDDSSDIGLALACLLSDAIHFREFKEWLYHVIEHDNDPPSYIFDMLDNKLRRDVNHFRIMGWSADPKLTDEEYGVLFGIGFRRGIRNLEDVITREDAVNMLKSNESFYKRVQVFFPFLDLDQFVGPDPDKGW